MNPTTAHALPAAIESAVQRVKMAARGAAERCVDNLGSAALASANVFQRDNLLNAQFELNRKLGVFGASFDEALDQRVEREVLPRSSTQGSLADTSFDALALVENHEVELQVSAERIGLHISQACEAEQRELDAFVTSLLASRLGEAARNPLRPEVIGNAMIRSVDRVTERPELRQLLVAEMERVLTASMAKTYAGIVAELKAAGVKPMAMGFRPSGSGFSRSTSGADTGSRPGGLDDSRYGGSPFQGDGRDTSGWRPSRGGAENSRHGARSEHSGLGRGDFGHSMRRAGHTAPASMGTPIGQVDAGLMALIRRLAFSDPGGGGDSQFYGDDGGYGASPSSGFDPGQPRVAPVAPNLIRTHRDALRQASNGSLDHMVIDVIGSLFDQILSDPKVPPQLARQIARLQLPVLRAALGDASFFSSRKHPVRRFVNRIASLGSAFDDFETAAGKRFLTLVRELVQEIVEGDFDQIEVYEHKLTVLEAFTADQAGREIQESGDAASLLAEKETDLRLQQRYAQQVQALLKPLPMADFVRDFLSQVWSQALMRATRLDGGSGSARMQRLRHAGRELVMSVQPKGSPAQRKAFLLQLPTLMKELNEGMDLIGWPDSAKKTFFGQLLPAHAESLKGEALRTLDYNLLARQVDAALGETMPSAAELPPPSANLPVLRDEVVTPDFSPEEAQRIGLMDEAAVDWDGQVDIEIGAEPEVAHDDLAIEGLPKPDAVEPSRGKSLADHVQIGFAYQMHLEGAWHKVRLSHVSAGRTFFVFTRGSRHKRSISMTHRMLVRLCETGRLRAFENGYLLERATARARKQLAALKPALAAQ